MLHEDDVAPAQYQCDELQHPEEPFGHAFLDLGSKASRPDSSMPGRRVRPKHGRLFVCRKGSGLKEGFGFPLVQVLLNR